VVLNVSLLKAMYIFFYYYSKTTCTTGITIACNAGVKGGGEHEETQSPPVQSQFEFVGLVKGPKF